MQDHHHTNHDGSGPISESLKALAASAARARDEREQREAERRENMEIMLAACEACVDFADRVCLMEVAESLGWTNQFAARVARNLSDAGRFPYRLKARDVAASAASKGRCYHRDDRPDYSEEHAKFRVWRAGPATVAARREDGRRYVREWQAMRKGA